jgi:hypothetical protein
VKHNIAFAEDTGRFDPAYVSGLSDDAVPTLVAALSDLDPVTSSMVLARLCPPHRAEQKGWAAFNVARHRAFQVLASACADRP